MCSTGYIAKPKQVSSTLQYLDDRMDVVAREQGLLEQQLASNVGSFQLHSATWNSCRLSMQLVSGIRSPAGLFLAPSLSLLQYCTSATSTLWQIPSHLEPQFTSEALEGNAENGRDAVSFDRPGQRLGVQARFPVTLPCGRTTATCSYKKRHEPRGWVRVTRSHSVT